MSDNNPAKTRLYLEECLQNTRLLIRYNSGKKKTLKQKAYNSILRIIESRLDAKVKVLMASIGDDSATIAGLQIQKSLYEDVLDFLAKDILGPVNEKE